MTSIQVDVTSLRTAAWQLAKAADDLALDHDRAGRVLDRDVPALHGGAAAQAQDMLQKALAAASVLGESDRRLAKALNEAAADAQHLQTILVGCFTPGSGT